MPLEPKFVYEFVAFFRVSIIRTLRAPSKRYDERRHKKTRRPGPAPRRILLDGQSFRASDSLSFRKTITVVRLSVRTALVDNYKNHRERKVCVNVSMAILHTVRRGAPRNCIGSGKRNRTGLRRLLTCDRHVA